MKYIMLTVLSLGLAFGASAQRSKPTVVKTPRPPQKVVIIRGGVSPFYSPWGYGPFWGSRFGYGYDPFYRQAPVVPSKLDLEIADIRNDYRDRIRSVRMDDKLSRKEKRALIRSFKHEREKDIIDAQRSYYKRR